MLFSSSSIHRGSRRHRCFPERHRCYFRRHRWDSGSVPTVSGIGAVSGLGGGAGDGPHHVNGVSKNNNENNNNNNNTTGTPALKLRVECLGHSAEARNGAGTKPRARKSTKGVISYGLDCSSVYSFCLSICLPEYLLFKF